MIRYFWPTRKAFSLVLSAIIFFEAPLWAGAAKPQFLGPAKILLNKTHSGKKQTLRQWWSQAKPILGSTAVAELEPFIKAYPDMVMPAITAKVQNKAEFGNILVLKFRGQDKKNRQLVIRERNKKIEFEFENKIYSAQELRGILNKAVVHKANRQETFLTFEEFKKRASKDYKWGVKYLKAIQNFVVLAEENQGVLRASKNKKTSLLFELFVPRAEAEDYNHDNTCIMGGWISEEYDTKTGNCITNDHKCTDDTKKVECNPALFGKGLCAEIKNKEKVSFSCAEQSGLAQVNDAQSLKRYINEKFNSGDFNSTLFDLRQLRNDYINVCLENAKAEDVTKNPNLLNNVQNFSDNDFSFNQSGTKWEHNRKACKAVLKSLAYVDDLINENPTTPPPVKPPPAKDCSDIAPNCKSVKCGETDAIKCGESGNSYQCPAGDLTKPHCAVPGDEPPPQSEGSGGGEGDKEGLCDGTAAMAGCVGASILALFLTAVAFDYLFGDRAKNGKDGKNGTNGINGTNGTNGTNTTVIIHEYPNGNNQPLQEPSCDHATGICTGVTNPTDSTAK